MDDIIINNLSEKEIKNYVTAVNSDDMNEIKHWTKVARSREARK